MPATVRDAASLTTPETTVRSFEVRSPAELRSREIAGAVESLAPGSVAPVTVTVEADVTRPGVGDAMSSRGAVVSIVKDHAVVARFPAKSPACTIIVCEPSLNVWVGVKRTVPVG